MIAWQKASPATKMLFCKTKQQNANRKNVLQSLKIKLQTLREFGIIKL